MGVIELVMSRIRWLADSYRFINAWAQVPIMCKLSYVDISIKQQPLCNKVLVHLFFLRICKYIIKIWSTYMNNDSSFHKIRRISTQWYYLGLAWSIYIRNKWNQSFFQIHLMVNVQSSPQVIALSPNIHTCVQKPPIITSLNNHLWNQAPFLCHTSERTGITAIESGEIWGETHRSVQPLRRLDTDMRDEGKVTVCQRKSASVPDREEGGREGPKGKEREKGKKERFTMAEEDIKWAKRGISTLKYL